MPEEVAHVAARAEDDAVAVAVVAAFAFGGFVFLVHADGGEVVGIEEDGGQFLLLDDDPGGAPFPLIGPPLDLPQFAGTPVVDVPPAGEGVLLIAIGAGTFHDLSLP